MIGKELVIKLPIDSFNSFKQVTKASNSVDLKSEISLQNIHKKFRARHSIVEDQASYIHLVMLRHFA